MHEWSDYERLARKLVNKQAGLLASRGIGADEDELMSEAMLTFVMADRKFNPNQGVRFSTYYWRALENNLRRLNKRRTKEAIRTTSIDAPLGEDTSLTLHDRLGSESECPADAIMRGETRIVGMNALSDDARQVVLMLESPPPALRLELRRCCVFAEMVANSGYARHHPKIDITFICNALGFSDQRRRRVAREIKDLAYG